MEDYMEIQSEELEALKAIYEDEITVVSRLPITVMIPLTDEELENKIKGQMLLKVTFPATYPDEAPSIEVPKRLKILGKDQHDALMVTLNETAVESIGAPMVYQLVEAGREFLRDVDVSELIQDDVHEEDEETNEDQVKAVEKILIPEGKPQGGKWDFVIGLVGKPSAGKSTFFNAVTNLDQAKTAAHPFTTIDPNIGRAYYTIPCPCLTHSKQCDAAFGHDIHGGRYLPVKIKDVAGLVPGACDGKGKGNRFLNDLLDADVLIHIVDISGLTDETGKETTDHDPCKDVAWLQEEIHRWIYDNIMDKWDIIRKRPHRLVDMFTGYHATKAVIHSALTQAGIDDKELANISQWPPSVLHKIVNSFLDIRFPIYLALNKADTPHAQNNIERLKRTYPEAHLRAVSAKAECYLQKLRKASVLDYHPGSPIFEIIGPLVDTQEEDLQHLTNTVLQSHGSTNVHRALSEAVLLRKPSFVYPVQCLETLTSIDKYRDRAPGRLRDCVCLKPETSVEEVYTALCHYPLQLITGDFIRAEAVDASGNKRIVKKDDIITEDNAIIKIMTNRKISQIKSKE